MRDAMVFVLVCALIGCGGSNRAAVANSPSDHASSSGTAPEHDPVSAAASAAPLQQRPPGPLTRAEVEALIARGLGAFLARVDVSPVLDSNGHFVGFRLDRAEDLADWNAAGADIHLGDVILRVNGIRIERPEQALWAFERLRIAPSIEVDLLRNGARQTLRSPIIDPAIREQTAAHRE